MRGFQNYERNLILTMAFWATCKIAHLKKPLWEFNFFYIFGIPSSSRHEKCCQILQTLFWVFQYSRNSQCGVQQASTTYLCTRPSEFKGVVSNSVQSVNTMGSNPHLFIYLNQIQICLLYQSQNLITGESTLKKLRRLDVLINKKIFFK